MTKKVVHAVRTPHERFPRTFCGRTLDLVRDHKHRVAKFDEEANCTSCRDAR